MRSGDWVFVDQRWLRKVEILFRLRILNSVWILDPTVGGRDRLVAIRDFL
jgi:hypothetical protein